MTLPLFGNPISFSQIQTEMGGSNPISLSEYYAGGGLTPSRTLAFPSGSSPAVPVPTSGAISVNDFFGSQGILQYTISSNQTGLLINSSLLISAGWNGLSRVRIVINSGVTIDATSVGQTTGALSIFGTFYGGIEIVNYGIIRGRGGNGGNAASVSQSSSTSISVIPPTTGSAGGSAIGLSVGYGTIFPTPPSFDILNYGTILGGGGGGGGGAAGYVAAIDKRGDIYFFQAYGGGGGGGGRSSTTSSLGGSGSGISGTSGQPGTTSGPGNGGLPGSGGGAGGAGGNYGTSGSSGNSGSTGSGAAGGATGAAVYALGTAGGLSVQNLGSGSYLGPIIETSIFA